MLIEEKDERAVSEFNELEREWMYARAARSLPPGRVQSDDRVTPEDSISPDRLKLARAGIKHLSSIIQQLVGLRRETEEDEYGILRASKHAFDASCRLLIDAAIASALEGRQIPRGCVSTDSEGGVRIEWVRAAASVRLVTPAADDDDPYVYHEAGNAYGTEPASAESLTHWLRIIND